ncbi:OmpH family outer membrane protein [bacterium]|nr:OmpH family outer membrane protein [bacterium]
MSFRIKSILMSVLILSFFTAFVPIFTGIAGSAELKIGYINSQRILEESKAGRDATKSLENLEKEKTGQVEQKKKEIDDLENELRKKEFAITPERKKEIEDNIRHKSLELKFFGEVKDKEIKDLYIKSLKKVESQVMEIVLQIGQQEGYDLVLGRDESGILFANPKHDLTEKVIQIYDQKMQQ